MVVVVVVVGGEGYLWPTTYSLYCHHQNNCIKAGSCVSHFNVSFIAGGGGGSQDSVHKPQFFEEKGEPKRTRTDVCLLTGLSPYRCTKPAHKH